MEPQLQLAGVESVIVLLVLFVTIGVAIICMVGFIRVIDIFKEDWDD
uniref:Uncharacterized protein n=1 Tax=viral metagenome TaxID=1070528 RepID=A0A6M3LTB4_9ZZZZ